MPPILEALNRPLVILDATAEGRGSVCWSEIAACWPGAAPPPVRMLTAIHGPVPGAFDRAVEGSIGALVIGDGARAGTTLRRLTRLLEQHGLGGVWWKRGEALACEGANGFGLIEIDANAAPQTVAGALMVLGHRQGFVDELRLDISLEQSLKEQAGKQLNRMQQEIARAAMMQGAFLPSRLPEVNGLDVAVLFRPVCSTSGDLYDVVALDEHRTGFLVADACGHGVSAAMLTMIASRLLPTTSRGRKVGMVSPGEALAELNLQIFLRQGEVPMLITAVCGVIDARDGTVTLASAGHPPPLIIGPESTRTVDGSGAAAGVFEDAEFPEITVKLGFDETLLVHTDGFEGVFMHEPGPGPRGKKPLDLYRGVFARFFNESQGRPLDETMRALSHTLDGQSGSLHQYDDLTLLAISRRPLRRVGEQPSVTALAA